jgi:hypothetical protein
MTQGPVVTELVAYEDETRKVRLRMTADVGQYSAVRINNG